MTEKTESKMPDVGTKHLPDREKRSSPLLAVFALPWLRFYQSVIREQVEKPWQARRFSLGKLWCLLIETFSNEKIQSDFAHLSCNFQRSDKAGAK